MKRVGCSVPTANNAWDLYERYERLSIAESEKEAAKDDLLIALASAGEKVLWAYRRGDQVIQLDAAKYQDAALLFDRASEIEPEDIRCGTKPSSYRDACGRKPSLR